MGKIRKTLVLDRKEYGDIIEPYMEEHISARNKAYSPHVGANENDYATYVKARETVYETRKSILQRHGIPCDGFVECIRSRDKQTFLFIWWEDEQ